MPTQYQDSVISEYSTPLTVPSNGEDATSEGLRDSFLALANRVQYVRDFALIPGSNATLNTLTTADDIVCGGDFQVNARSLFHGTVELSSIITATLAGSVSFLNPVGWTSCNVCRILPTSGNVFIGGFPPVQTGGLKLILNVSDVSYEITIPDKDDPTATLVPPSYRVAMPSNLNHHIRNRAGMWIWYDLTSACWRTVGLNAGYIP